MSVCLSFLTPRIEEFSRPRDLLPKNISEVTF